jgi:iron complex outermembrane recepter protein
MNRHSSRILAAILLSGGSTTVTAQEDPRGDTITAVPVAGVTVTVLRTPIPLSRAPYAVSVVEAGSLSPGAPGLGLDEALRAVPGVQVDNRYNYALGERISVRGFGARAQFGVRGVRVLVDGVPATFPDGQTSLSHLDLTYLDRAEIVRGPASTMYGGSSGGVLQLETIRPAAGERVREAGMAAGSHELLRAHASVGEGYDRGSYVVRLSHQGYGGERDHSTARNLRFHAGIRHALSWGELSVSAAGVDYDADNPGSLSETLLAEDRTQAFQNNVRQRTGEEGRQAQIGATLTATVGPGALDLSAYALDRSVLNPIPASIIDLHRRVAGARAVYRLSAAPGSLALGAEGAAQRDGRLNYTNEEGSAGATTLDQDESVDDLALFVQGTINPVEPLTLLGGVRYDWYRFSVEDELEEAGNPDDSGRIDMSQVSPSLGASLRLTPEVNLYANVATAFETPTTTELANRPTGAGGFNPDLRPQETLSFEGGLKGFRSGVGSWELAGYTAEVTNALIPFEVAGMPDRQFFRNAGSARHRGVEAGVQLHLSAGLATRAAYTLTDARFAEYDVAGESFDGKRIPGIAPHRVEWVVDLAGPRSTFFTLDGRYASRTPVDDANSAHSPSYVVFDARGGFRALDLGGAELEPVVGVGNLFAAEYNSSVVVNAFGGRYFEPAPGRTVHAGLKVRF